MVGLIRGLSLMILMVLYIADRWVSATWQGLIEPVSLSEVLREWLLYTLLFGSVTVLLQKILDLACSTVCSG